MTKHRRAASFLMAFILALAWAAPSWARGHRWTGKGKRLIISVDSRMSEPEKRELARMLGLESVLDLDNIDIIIVELPDDQLLRQAEAKLRGYKRVEQVERDFYVKWIEAAPPGFQQVPFVDFGSQIPRFTPAEPGPNFQGKYPWGIARVNAPAAWARTQGQGVRVAVIDTGIDCSHPNLRCDYSEGFNFVDPSAPPMDDQGHGTHVAGAIAGLGRPVNGTAVYGVAPKARLMPVKVLDDQGGGSVSNIVEGINWAASHGAQVINMSLGAPEGSPALRRAIGRSLARGVTVVAASGNEGPDNGPSYPAAYPGVIAVAASDPSDRVAKFSSRGGYVSFIAPGVRILSSIPGGKYAEFSGTSMACPHVAGLAALAISMGADGPQGVAQTLGRAAKRLCTQTSCLPPDEAGAGMIDAGRLGR